MRSVDNIEVDRAARGLFIVATIAEEFAVTRCADGGAKHARAVSKNEPNMPCSSGGHR
jgi:hypothetical protein